jgi:hypothetical protein
MENLDKLIPALAPVFAAGLGIQQLGEILSPLLDKISTDYKKVVFGLISLTLGLAVASRFNLHVLNLLLDPLNNPNDDKFVWLDRFITGVIISGGTEGVNSILKFLKFKKEETKNDAAIKSPLNPAGANAPVVPVPTPAALAEINSK